jgi:hypothetical protein
MKKTAFGIMFAILTLTVHPAAFAQDNASLPFLKVGHVGHDHHLALYVPHWKAHALNAITASA